ncbi:isochorismatase [Carbonactinospora thermoautotrophica]|uniref:Isochorismatase n=1 Tax=Carbonactinospora thermoautotrophica TaxID=1469144 RepID=A0A132MUD3_9ACTN|nr:isochorismatase family protein [Carbonactinospora thermoautotrophica]KWX00481.1 isochorismatase [Carbonactinospora thermoautotrophica]KWX01457.1 Isochorismatase [Carbonactinospora thermoautotrophica]KWX05640.1 isochorismatase [Carbonactinospora thermoautotrophica]MCX9192900.1 isochorismatase [Carbonactinospora thermoautotrophica]
MGIPAIRPYPMPTERELPENQVSWRPDPDRAALLIHDMQRYFVDFFPAGQSPRNELLANIQLIRRTAAELDMPVVYTAQPGAMTREQRGLLHDFWGPGMSDDPGHKRIVDELAPAEGDIVLTKWRYSAFHRSDLADIIRGQGRDQLIVCGVYAHVGCLMTACDAFALDIQPFLVADAVADFTPEYHRMALAYAAERCAATIFTRTLVGLLSRSGLQPVS